MAKSTTNSTLSGRLVRNINNSIIIWLDTNSDKLNSSIFELNRIINYCPIRTFSHPDDCFAFLIQINNEQLKYLTKQIRKETWGSSGWRQLCHLMIKMREFDKAEEIYK